MKCPKCGYLGFETSDRCRNCGYDFSLAVHIEASSDLSLRDARQAEAALADFDLSGLDTSSPPESSSELDLDRLLGGPSTLGPAEPPPAPSSRAAAEPPRASAMSRERARPVDNTGVGSRESGVASGVSREPTADARPPTPGTRKSAVATPPPAEVQAPFQPGEAGDAALPLFVEPGPQRADRPAATEARRNTTADDGSVMPPPRPALAPLAVRRATPEVQRRRTPRPLRRDAGDLSLQLEPGSGAEEVVAGDETTTAGVVAPPRWARLAAALIDLVLLGGIDAAVLYLTLAIAGLSFDQLRVVPVVPMGAFLLLLNGGYLVAFTAASGQTIGKMLTGTRVLGDDGRSVDVGGALLRTLGCAVSLLTLGVGYLPALATAEGRALQDRLAGTKVVKL